MSDLSTVKGIQTKELAILNARRIKTVEDLWERVGDDFEQGVTDLETTTGIPAARLRELLQLELRQFAAQKPAAQDAWLASHWLELVLVLVALTLALLWLRAVGGFAALPVGADLSGQVVVSGAPLEKGEVLESAALGLARVVAVRVFTDTTALEGLIAANPIAAGKPIRYADVLRPQVLAAEDIPAGTLLSAAVVTTTWSAYLPDAATQLSAVVNHKSTRPLQKGQVIERDWLEPLPAADRVVVWREGGVKAFEILDARALTVQPGPVPAGAFGSVEALVGRMVLADVVSGTVLTAEQVSAAPVAVVTQGRKAVTVPLPLDRLDPALQPGALVTLVFYPLAAEVGTGAPVETLADVPVLAITRLAASAGVTVAVPADRAAGVLARVGHSELFLVTDLP